jgi:RND family efflux transporter MFP subunit
MRALHLLWIAGVTAAAFYGCSKREANETSEPEPWAVTSWGAKYEIFAEADPLVVGAVSKSHTHVTVLDGFAPLRAGTVSAILRDSAGAEKVFTRNEPVRDGIFSIEIRPEQEGEFDLAFRVESEAGIEEIPSGRVSVGTAAAPGGLLAAPSSTDSTLQAGAAHPGDISFLKEQAWRIPFATAWAESGSIHRSVRGPALVRASAGGEAVLTAPLDGVVVLSPKLHVGRDVQARTSVVQLVPRARSGRSFAEIDSELGLAKTRLERLTDLLKVEAVSEAEVERARAHVATLEAELAAVGGRGKPVDVRTPLTGRIAEVLVEPGQAVDAGASLARVVKLRPVWVEVALRPDDAASIETASGLVIQRRAGEDSIELTGDQVRLISRAPEVNPQTGAIQVIFEVEGDTPLELGTSVDAEVLLPGGSLGIVVPSSAIVDDAGVPVVYVQAEGESFARVEVQIEGRQGDHVLVQGLQSGERVVTLGGAAIRRATQLSSGPVEGHVH